MRRPFCILFVILTSLLCFYDLVSSSDKPSTNGTSVKTVGTKRNRRNLKPTIFNDDMKNTNVQPDVDPTSANNWKRIGKPYKIKKRNDNNLFVLEVNDGKMTCRRRNLADNTLKSLKWKTCASRTKQGRSASTTHDDLVTKKARIGRRNAKTKSTSSSSEASTPQTALPSIADPTGVQKWKQLGKPYKIKRRNDGNLYVVETTIENSTKCIRRNLNDSSFIELKWITCADKLKRLTGEKRVPATKSRANREVSIQQRVWYFDGIICKSYVKGQDKSVPHGEYHLSVCMERLSEFYQTIDVVLIKKMRNRNNRCVIYSGEGGVRDKMNVVQCQEIVSDKVYYVKENNKCQLKIGWHDTSPIERPMSECDVKHSKSKSQDPDLRKVEPERPDFYYFKKIQCMVLRNPGRPNKFIESAPMDECLEKFKNSAEFPMHVRLMEETDDDCLVYRADGKKRIPSDLPCNTVKTLGEVYYSWRNNVCLMIIPVPSRALRTTWREKRECNTVNRMFVHVYEPASGNCVEKDLRGPVRHSKGLRFLTVKECNDHAAAIWNKGTSTTSKPKPLETLDVVCLRDCENRTDICLKTDCANHRSGCRKYHSGIRERGLKLLDDYGTDKRDIVILNCENLDEEGSCRDEIGCTASHEKYCFICARSEIKNNRINVPYEDKNMKLYMVLPFCGNKTRLVYKDVSSNRGIGEGENVNITKLNSLDPEIKKNLWRKGMIHLGCPRNENVCLVGSEDEGCPYYGPCMACTKKRADKLNLIKGIALDCVPYCGNTSEIRCRKVDSCNKKSLQWCRDYVPGAARLQKAFQYDMSRGEAYLHCTSFDKNSCTFLSKPCNSSTSDYKCQVCTREIAEERNLLNLPETTTTRQLTVYTVATTQSTEPDWPETTTTSQLAVTTTATTPQTTELPTISLLCVKYCKTEELRCTPTNDCSGGGFFGWGRKTNCYTHPYDYEFMPVEHVTDRKFVLCKKTWFSGTECKIVDDCMDEENCHICPLYEAYDVGLLKEDATPPTTRDDKSKIIYETN